MSRRNSHISDPYQILGIHSLATDIDIVRAHNRLEIEITRLYKDQPHVYKIRKMELDSARNTLLDSSKRAKIDRDIIDKSKDATTRSGYGFLLNIVSLHSLMVPFRKLGLLLWYIFGPSLKRIASALVGFSRVAIVVLLVWSIAFAPFSETYRNKVLSFTSVVYNDFQSVMPDINVRQYLPEFLGGRYTYNSMACEKIRLKFALAQELIDAEGSYLKGANLIGLGAAFSKLVQGDTNKAKEYGARTSLFTAKRDKELAKAKIYIRKVKIDQLECVRKPK